MLESDAFSDQCQTRQTGGPSVAARRFTQPLKVLIHLSLRRTGVHTVADVTCVGCHDRLGWFYHKASNYSQKYKEGGYLNPEPFAVLTLHFQESICWNVRN